MHGESSAFRKYQRVYQCPQSRMSRLEVLLTEAPSRTNPKGKVWTCLWVKLISAIFTLTKPPLRHEFGQAVRLPGPSPRRLRCFWFVTASAPAVRDVEGWSRLAWSDILWTCIRMAIVRDRKGVPTYHQPHFNTFRDMISQDFNILCSDPPIRHGGMRQSCHLLQKCIQIRYFGFVYGIKCWQLTLLTSILQRFAQSIS